jgi:hypothetical protein
MPCHRKSLRRRSKVLALSAAELGKPIEEEKPRHGANVAIVDRFADIDRRPELVDLIRRQVAAIVRPHHRRTTPSARDESISRVAYISGVH